tara:strand:+ start:687 stop:2585 length:1899 start_codon:yes stop_codon:yes gene_type:complete
MTVDKSYAEYNSAQIASLNKLILRSIVDHAVVTLDAKGFITSWNEGAERILGWNEDEAIGMSADIFFTDADTDQNRPETEMRLAIEKGRAEDVRWHVRKDGVRFWGSGLMMPLLKETDADGNAIQNPDVIDGFVKIFRDRTAEREANLRITRLQDRASLAMRRSGTVGVFDYDLENNLIVSDHTCALLHSINVESAERGTPVQAFIDGILPEDQANAKQAFDATTRDSVDLDVTYRVVTHGPRPTWLHSQGTLQHDEDGQRKHLTGIVVDISEQQEHLRIQEARLEFADEVRNLNDPVEIAQRASRVIGKTLYATRVGHGVFADDSDTIDIKADWNEPGSESFVGKQKYSDFGGFGSVLHDGRKVIIGNVKSDPRVDDPVGLEGLGIRALINLPLMENGKLKAVLFVHDAKPRDWTKAEITFLGAMFDQAFAAMDRVRHEAERNMLSEELAHRIKNVLTIGQIIVKQSLRKIPGLKAEREAIVARFQALGGAQDVLTRAKEKEADILSVVEATLAPHLPQPGRIIVTGPSIALNSQQVLGLSLALHELATNASKYGALSNEDGQILINWKSRDGSFEFSWVEQHGPPVDKPDSQGFGSTILQRAAGAYFSGRSELIFHENGIRFEISGHLDR